jgi:hypothetical protein
MTDRGGIDGAFDCIEGTGHGFTIGQRHIEPGMQAHPMFHFFLELDGGGQQ